MAAMTTDVTAPVVPRPGGTDIPPARRYDVALLDLDGVVYIGTEAVPGAREALAAAAGEGMRLAYVTNNASRTPEAVAELLNGLGVPADPADVVTSSQAAARLLAERLAPGAAVLVVGGPALRREVEAVGLRAVGRADAGPEAVVQGWAPGLGWADLAEAAYAVAGGAWWVATNVDRTIPTARGIAPGNGALVGAVRIATGVEPVVAGKPQPPLHRETILRTGARHPLVVGDRLDTDIEGAVAAGADSLLVLTGVTGPADLLAAPPRRRPTYVAADLSGLLTPHPQPTRTADGGHHCGGWTATVADGVLHLDAPTGGDPLNGLRAACAAAWSAATPPDADHALAATLRPALARHA